MTNPTCPSHGAAIECGAQQTAARIDTVIDQLLQHLPPTVGIQDAELVRHAMRRLASVICRVHATEVLERRQHVEDMYQLVDDLFNHNVAVASELYGRVPRGLWAEHAAEAHTEPGSPGAD